VLIQKKQLDEKDISTMLTASLSVALLFFIILFSLAPWIAGYYDIPEIQWPLRALSLILFLNAVNSVQTAILSRTMDFRTIFLRTAIAVPISGIIGIAMAYWGYGVWALVTHNLLNMLIMIIVMYWGTNITLRLGFSMLRAKEMYSFSVKILLSNLISGFGDTVRTMTIGKQYSRNDLAYYDKAYTYAYYVTSIIHASIQSVMLPVFSRQQDDIDILRNTNRKTVRMVSFVMFPVMIGAIMASKPFIILLLTEKWASSVDFFMLFCFFRLMGCVTSVDKQTYYALGRSDIAMYFEIGLLLVNLTMLFVMVNYGVWAIAVGATIVEFLGCITLCIISSKIYFYKLRQRFYDLALPLLNSLVMALVLYVIIYLNLGYAETLSLQVLVGIIVYLMMAKITRDENLQAIILLIKKIKI
jgi:Membrane protein involved in the export of O-antigen and teichoic acid